MSLKSSIPVRFSAETSERLKAVSENTGIPTSKLIRIATENYLKEIGTAGAITIPINETGVPYRTKKPKP